MVTVLPIRGPHFEQKYGAHQLFKPALMSSAELGVGGGVGGAGGAKSKYLRL